MKVTRLVELVEMDCCSCDITYAVPERWKAKWRQEGQTFYCPIGHPQVYTASDNKILRDKVAALESKLTHAQDQLQAAAREVNSAKREANRQRKRAAAGVCPCCNRTFQDVARHMKGQHPDYAESR